MKILVIPSWYPPEGGGFVVDQSQWMEKLGHKISVVTVETVSLKKLNFKTFFSRIKTRETSEYNLQTWRVGFYRIPKWYWLNTVMWTKLIVSLVDKHIKKYGQPDIIHAHSCLWAGYAASKIKKKYNIPYIITEHRGRFNSNNHTKQSDFLPWFRPVIKTALQNADTIIPVSKLLIPSLEEYAQKQLNCFVIPNPVDDELFTISDVYETGDVIRFIHVSNFARVKAIKILVQAFEKLLQKVSEAQLHIVGDGDERTAIQKLINERGLNHKIICLGKLDKESVKNAYQRSDFLVISSYNEAQPIVIGEATLCGIPVIATDVVSEDDVPAHTGIIVKTGSCDALAEGMYNACVRRNDFDTTSIRKFAENRFSFKIVIPQIIEVLEKSLKKNES